MNQKKTALVKLLTVETVCLFLALCSMFAVSAFAEVVNPIEGGDIPIWLKPILDMIIALPYVGPFILSVLKWIGVIAAVFTGVATLFAAVAKALQKMGELAGFVDFAEKVQGIYDAVWPWLAWLSVYNVPKRR